MIIILDVLAFLVIAYFNVPKLVRAKEWRELTVFMALYALGMTLSILLIIGVTIPSPIKGAQYILKDVLHLNYK